MSGSAPFSTSQLHRAKFRCRQGENLMTTVTPALTPPTFFKRVNGNQLCMDAFCRKIKIAVSSSIASHSIAASRPHRLGRVRGIPNVLGHIIAEAQPTMFWKMRGHFLSSFSPLWPSPLSFPSPFPPSSNPSSLPVSLAAYSPYPSLHPSIPSSYSLSLPLHSPFYPFFPPLPKAAKESGMRYMSSLSRSGLGRACQTVLAAFWPQSLICRIMSGKF